jgi:hypothetical protein
MIRHRITAAVMVALFAFIASGCASTVLINSTPEGAQVFVDGQAIGYTPVSYTDTGIVMSTRQVELRLDGYEVHRAVVRRDAELNVGALLGGIFCLWPLFLWVLDYPSRVHYEMRPLRAEAQTGHRIEEMPIVVENLEAVPAL